MKHSLILAVMATFLSCMLCIYLAQSLPEPLASEPEPMLVETVYAQPLSFDRSTTITVLFPEGRKELPLRDYLLGVLPGEMPASFALEAKKAQAAAARTFALKTASGSKHDGAVCTDSTCCQAWTDPASLSPEELEEAARAIDETDGRVLCYQGMLIDAVFFSCSGGRTEAAVAVWGSDVAYLQAVDSPGEEDAPAYCDTVTISNPEFRQIMGLSGDPDDWFGPVQRTDGGGVASMQIGGKTYSGVELRRLLGLRSANFTVEQTDDCVIFHTLGYGHRVGLSQYGADAMARAGAGWEDILHHYYQGIDIEAR